MSMDDSTKLHTEAITSYDGIFKGMHDDNVRNIFYDARKALTDGAWSQGKQLLKDGFAAAGQSPNDRITLKLIIDEVNRYEACKIKPGIEPVTNIAWDDVAGRSLLRLSEKFCDFPQSVFFLQLGEAGKQGSIRLVGRKILSDYWISGKIPELHCSLITADMILGLFSDQRITETYVHAFYHPLTDEEKLGVMKNVLERGGANTEIICPFPLLRKSTHKELNSPPEGWIVDDTYDAMLGCGEERIRGYTIKFLEEVGKVSIRLYDPACSTGVFLSTLKNRFPSSYTIGQDLSQQMADFSRERVDEVYCGNAMNPMIEPGTADVVFIRFLNSEVVNSAEAEALLQALLPAVRCGGYIVTFGHTPVLLSRANFKQLSNFTYKQSVGVAPDNAGIFQYYVIQRQ